MTPLTQEYLEAHQPLCLWDIALEVLLAVLLVFAPLALACSSAWSREAVVGLAAAMAICLAGKNLFRRDIRFVWSWAYLPIVLFLGFIGLQLVPLPASVLGLISPHTLATKTRLLGDMPDAPQLLRRLPMTFYPFGTRADFRMVLAVATVFVVVINVYRRPVQIKRLLWVVAIVGAAVAAIAAQQNLSHATHIYGVFRMAHPNSGPFLNHSHFGQFMNMSIGAMLALLLVRVGEIIDGSRKFGPAFGPVHGHALQIIWLLAALMFCCAFVLFRSGTRGGVLALLIAGTITAVLWIFRGADVGRASAIMVICAVVFMLLFVAAFDQVYTRLATVMHVANANESRLQVLKDLSVMWRQFPLVGTGLGTHEFVFPMFDRSNILSLAKHAENEYAELMEECGIIGLGLAMVFLGIIVRNYVGCIWKSRQPIHLAAFGLGFGLIAILFHSFSDFGQHSAPDAALTAVFFGLLISLARRGMPPPISKPNRTRIPGWASIAFRSVALLAVAALFALMLPGANAAAREDFAWDKVWKAQDVLDRHDWADASVDELNDLLRPAQEAVKYQPDNVVIAFYLADYRWRAISRGKVMSDVNLQFTRPIIDELHAARALCPTYAPLYCLAGQLERSILHLPEGEQHIRMGYELDRCNPDGGYAMSILDAEQGRWDDSLAIANRTIKLDPTFATYFRSAYLDMGRADLAYELVAGNREGLRDLADALRTDPKQQALVSRCDAEASALLAREASGPDATPGSYAEFAQECARRGEDRQAIDLYERALARDYGQVDWRFQLALLLAKTGDLDGAAREARGCLNIRPQMQEAIDLLNSVNARRAVGRS